jgi:hypothetical protein
MMLPPCAEVVPIPIAL